MDGRLAIQCIGEIKQPEGSCPLKWIGALFFIFTLQEEAYHGYVFDLLKIVKLNQKSILNETNSLIDNNLL